MVHRATACAASLLLCLLAAGTASAYNVALTWRPGAASGTAGYRLHVREEGRGEREPIDLGLPSASGDGLLTAVVGDLAVERTYVFALSAYTADGVEGPLSNERTIGYADAARVVDSDHDGLPDASEDPDLDMVRGPDETERLAADTDGDLVPDGVERSYGSDPLERGTPVCDPLPFDDWAIVGNGSGKVVRDAKLREPVLRTVSSGRGPLAVAAVYPRAPGHVTTPVVVVPVRADARLRIDLRVRSTEGRRYLVRLEGFGDHGRVHRRRLVRNLGSYFDGRTWAPLGIDVPTELARIDPDAVFDFVERIIVRGALDVARIRLCR